MDFAELNRICALNGLSLTEIQLTQLAHYDALLREWNQKVNLISRKDEDNIVEKHILHSLTLAFPNFGVKSDTVATVLDIGTGGGLPGIPLAIAMPSWKITMVDSIAKKIKAVEEMVQVLGLTSRVVTIRVENWKPGHTFDLIVSRATAPLPDLIKWSRHLIRKDGVKLLALKGGNLSEEIAQSEKMKSVLNVDSRLLEIEGYNGFKNEEKRIVRVNFGVSER